MSLGDIFTFPARKQSREDKCLFEVVPGQELDSGLLNLGAILIPRYHAEGVATEG